MQELYIVSKQRVIYMEDKKTKWIYSIKNTNDYKVFWNTYKSLE